MSPKRKVRLYKLSVELKQTVIVPTLVSSIPEGKSAIWCAEEVSHYTFRRI